VAPLIGVLAHHWTVFAVVLLYWCENVVLGVFNVLRMLCARPQDRWRGRARRFSFPSSRPFARRTSAGLSPR
jgi:hypothetical protein